MTALGSSTAVAISEPLFYVCDGRTGLRFSLEK
jgi:hypothetical protein